MPTKPITITRYRGPHEHENIFFLRTFVENIAKRSHKYSRLYLKEYGILANGLLTGERGSYSLMAAAMDRITPMYESEMSVHRRRVNRLDPKNEVDPGERTGRVDLWSCFRGLEYFMEFKRSYLSADYVHGCDVPKGIGDKWRELDEQVDAARQGVGSNNGYEECTYFIGMHTITPYRTCQNEESINRSLEGDQFSVKKLRKWAKGLSPQPDAVFAWKIRKNRHKFCPISWDDDDRESRWETYPCHLFCFRIMRNEIGG